jgi:hypothetical protein
VRGTREAGGRIKPGAQAPGKLQKNGAQARETGDSPTYFEAVARFAGSNASLLLTDPGACAPGFILSPASRARRFFINGSWGWRPRLYRPLRGLDAFLLNGPGACAAGLNPRSRARTPVLLTDPGGWRPRLYAAARFAGSTRLSGNSLALPVISSQKIYC